MNDERELPVVSASLAANLTDWQNKVADLLPIADALERHRVTLRNMPELSNAEKRQMFDYLVKRARELGFLFTGGKDGLFIKQTKE